MFKPICSLGYFLLVLSLCSCNSGTTAMAPGTLSISPLAKTDINIGGSTTATVSLSGSSGITNPILVTITSSNTAVVSASPSSCNLTTDNNSCIILLSGITTGTATFAASAPNYKTIISESIVVINP